MVKLRPPLTKNQQVAIAIVPKFTAGLSMIGSGYIIVHVLVNPNRRRRVYHRILLGMGLMDIVSSFKSFLSTWPLPKGTAWGAVGTTQTCALAGFFGQGSSLAGPLYNGSLTLYYFLTIRNKKRWREERIRFVEPWLHAIPLAVGSSTAIAGMPLNLYNPIGWTCWIGPWPPGCKQTHEFGYTTCVRGDNSDIYRWAFFHCELWLTFLLTLLGMALIYKEARWGERMGGSLPPGSTARRLSKHDQKKERRRNWRRCKQGKHAHRVMVQAALFVAAFYLTWIFPAITWMTQLVRGETYTIILFLQAIFVPLQGTFNVLIYLRPRYIRNRDRYPAEGVRRALWRTLRSEAPAAHINRSSSSAVGENIGATSSMSEFFEDQHADESWGGSFNEDWRRSFRQVLRSLPGRRAGPGGRPSEEEVSGQLGSGISDDQSSSGRVVSVSDAQQVDGDMGSDSSIGRECDDLKDAVVRTSRSSNTGMEETGKKVQWKDNESTKADDAELDFEDEDESHIGGEAEDSDGEETAEELVD